MRPGAGDNAQPELAVISLRQFGAGDIPELLELPRLQQRRHVGGIELAEEVDV